MLRKSNILEVVGGGLLGNILVFSLGKIYWSHGRYPFAWEFWELHSVA